MASGSAGIAVRRLLAWRRLWPACLLATAVSLGLKVYFAEPRAFPVTVALGLAILGVVVFGLAESLPRRLPIPRWSFQAVAVGLAIVVATPFAFHAHRQVVPGAPIGDPHLFMFAGLLLGPWAVLAARYRDVNGQAQQLRLAFELQRTQFERQGLQARMKVLQAQIEPHFLFNTLANIQELVETGSPRSAAVLESLIAYLQAAVPRADDPHRTVAEEIELARRYLGIMLMRIPDRLEVSIETDRVVDSWRCPPMAVLTLVENAIRHGIDPSVRGGGIWIRAWHEGQVCRVRVADTGAGLSGDRKGLGTGLENLRERLRLEFGPGSRVTLAENAPRGVVAEMVFESGPAR